MRKIKSNLIKFLLAFLFGSNAHAQIDFLKLDTVNIHNQPYIKSKINLCDSLTFNPTIGPNEMRLGKVVVLSRSEFILTLITISNDSHFYTVTKYKNGKFTISQFSDSVVFNNAVRDSLATLDEGCYVSNYNRKSDYKDAFLYYFIHINGKVYQFYSNDSSSRTVINYLDRKMFFGVGLIEKFL